MSEQIAQEICKKAANWHFSNVADAFKLICINPTIDTAFQTVKRSSTPPRRWLNVHDKDHGLTVANYAIRLYELVVIEEPRLIEPSLKDMRKSLIATLAAAYMHDIGRWAKEEHADRSLAEIDGYLLGLLIEKYSREDVLGIILLNAKQWIEKHDDMDCQVESIEEGIVKLADKLDCDSKRACKQENGRPLPAAEVLRKDPQPWQYFGCLAIPEPVSLARAAGKRRVRITIPIESYAAAPQIKTIVRAIECTERIGLSAYVALFQKKLFIKGEPVELVWPEADTYVADLDPSELIEDFKLAKHLSDQIPTNGGRVRARDFWKERLNQAQAFLDKLKLSAREFEVDKLQKWIHCAIEGFRPLEDHITQNKPTNETYDAADADRLKDRVRWAFAYLVVGLFKEGRL